MKSLTREDWYRFAGLLKVRTDRHIPRRRIWLSDTFFRQFKEKSYDFRKDRSEYSPKSQIDGIFSIYMRGDLRLFENSNYKKLDPRYPNVYELKTHDFRIFGFLISKGEYCAVLLEEKRNLRNIKSYKAFIERTKIFIRDLKIPNPKVNKDEIDEIAD